MRRSESGSAILPLLGLSAITVALLVPFLDLVGVARNQAKILTQMVIYRAALDSAVDYTIYGLRQRWCFSQSWQPDGFCDMTHPRASERILLNDASFAAFRALINKNPEIPHTDPIILESIEHTLNLSDLSPSHPLYKVAESARGVFHSIHFEIRRVSNTHVPSRGREVTIAVKATLQAPAVIFKNLSSISQTSTILVSPRELSRFAFVVPRDMRLDKQTPNPEIGDVDFRHFGDKGEGGAGLVFESPVFVNRDIYLPAATTSGFTPVTFAGRVQMGSGFIYQGGQPLAPQTPGGFGHQFYNELPGFGGFLGGVDSDGIQDEGLNVLIAQDTEPPDTTNLRECAEHNLNISMLTRTKESSLMAMRIGGDGRRSFSYLLGLNHNNMFVPQEGPEIRTSVEIIQGEEHFETEPTIIPLGDPGITMVIAAGIEFTNRRGEVFRPKWIRARAHDRNTTITFPLNDGEFIEIQTEEYILNGRPQPNFVKIHVRAPDGVESLNDAKFIVRIRAMDVAHTRGFDYRTEEPKQLPPPAPPAEPTLDPNYSRAIELHFEGDDGDLREDVNFSEVEFRAYDPSLKDPTKFKAPAPDPYFDFAERHFRCTRSQEGAARAFTPTDWGESLTRNTRISWSFAVDSPDEISKTYPNNPANHPLIIDANSTKENFLIKSIYGTCYIRSSATKVFGFLTCDHLVIEPRNNPLLIIGTIIAGKTTIDQTAYNKGIRWRSIYHPQSVIDLRAAKVLQPLPGTTIDGKCQTIPSVPFWSPNVSITELANQRLCSPLALRDMADPFTWTTVDPDCGLIEDNAVTMRCKRRPLRFLVKEVSRASDI